MTKNSAPAATAPIDTTGFLASARGHKLECMCPACLIADMDAHLAAQGKAAPAADAFAAADAARISGQGNGTATRKATPAVKMATEKQIAFADSLLAERPDLPRDRALLAEYTSREISELIDCLKAQREERRAAPKAAPAEAVTEGMYRNPKTGEIYKVQRAVHGSGNLYAKLLNTDDMIFEYAAGAIRKLRPSWKMSLEEAREFGRLYGVCCVCAAPLTDEKSIAAGIGPVCAKKF